MTLNNNEVLIRVQVAFVKWPLYKMKLLSRTDWICPWGSDLSPMQWSGWKEMSIGCILFRKLLLWHYCVALTDEIWTTLEVSVTRYEPFSEIMQMSTNWWDFERVKTWWSLWWMFSKSYHRMADTHLKLSSCSVLGSTYSKLFRMSNFILRGRAHK